MFYVYLLQCNNCTYIGATVDLERRLRQHNKEITGGAKLTGSKVINGNKWSRLVYISGFPTWNAALQFEWKWKNLSKKYGNNNLNSIEKRLYALIELLGNEKSTKNSIPFSEWEQKPIINFENIDVEELFLSIIDE